MRGRVGVAVDDDGLNAKTLQFDDDFFAQLAAAQDMTRSAVGESDVPMWEFMGLTKDWVGRGGLTF